MQENSQPIHQTFESNTIQRKQKYSQIFGIVWAPKIQANITSKWAVTYQVGQARRAQTTVTKLSTPAVEVVMLEHEKSTNSGHGFNTMAPS